MLGWDLSITHTTVTCRPLLQVFPVEVLCITFPSCTQSLNYVLLCSITGSNVKDKVEEESTEGTRVGEHQEQTSQVVDSGLVPNSPEARFRDVLAIPVQRRPLFPGVIMPVLVKDNKVIKELIDIRKQG